MKSEKISIVELSRSVPDHSCTDAYRSTRTICNYKSEDQKAIDILKEAGIAYKLIDLSDCPFTVRLKAKIGGINETPTLILKNIKIEGIENVSQVLQETKT